MELPSTSQNYNIVHIGWLFMISGLKVNLLSKNASIVVQCFLMLCQSWKNNRKNKKRPDYLVINVETKTATDTHQLKFLINS